MSLGIIIYAEDMSNDEANTQLEGLARFLSTVSA
jgi:hypothetical protein